MVYQIVIDVCHYGSAVHAIIVAQRGQVVKVVDPGPGGGNPELTINFPTREEALEILYGHYEDQEDQAWIESQIKEIETEV